MHSQQPAVQAFGAVPATTHGRKQSFTTVHAV